MNLDEANLSPESSIDRRLFMAGLAAAAGLGGWYFFWPKNETLLDPPSGDRAFVEPTVLASSDGELELTLTAAAGSVSWGSGERFALTYNGTSPGPTLLVRPGDRLVVHLENQLDEPTNLHTHGLFVSPKGNSDNIFISVAPGETQTYEYLIPKDHRSGFFWYHPHAHGHVARQVAGGMAGAIVVVDQLDELPIMADSIERVMLLSDPQVGDGPEVLEVGDSDRMSGRQGNAVLINGVQFPTIRAKAGTKERWRIVNSSPSRYYRLSLPGHPFHLVATDGGRLFEPRSVDEVLLAPGERTELIVTPSQEGTYSLTALSYNRGGIGMGPMMGGRGAVDTSTGPIELATMVVAGNAAAAKLSGPIAPAVGFELAEPTQRRQLTLAMGMGGGMGGGRMMSFTIDGKVFDPDRVDTSTLLGGVEEWEVRNTSPMDHPFHLHVWAFLLENDPLGGWKDTVNVPAGGSVRFRVPIERFDGRTIYHCHILDHEDLGMMGTIEVSP